MITAAEAAVLTAQLGAIFQLMLVGGICCGVFLGWSVCSIFRNWVDSPGPERTIEQMQHQLETVNRSVSKP